MSKDKQLVEGKDFSVSVEELETVTIHAGELSPDKNVEQERVSKQWREGIKQYNAEYHRRANGRKIVRTTLIESCSFQGVLVKETAHFYVYAVDAHRKDGDIKTFQKRRIKKSKAHITPCKSCTDHPDTFYPEGNLN